MLPELAFDWLQYGVDVAVKAGLHSLVGIATRPEAPRLSCPACPQCVCPACQEVNFTQVLAACPAPFWLPIWLVGLALALVAVVFFLLAWCCRAVCVRPAPPARRTVRAGLAAGGGRGALEEFGQ